MSQEEKLHLRIEQAKEQVRVGTQVFDKDGQLVCAQVNLAAMPGFEGLKEFIIEKVRARGG